MSDFGLVIVFSLIGGLFSLIGGFLILSNKKLANGIAKYATPFAAGALLAAVFLDLLKEGIHESTADVVLLSALTGIVIFFFAEKFLRWFHHHHEHKSGKKSDPSAALIIAGDTLHNALDGVAIAAAFLINPTTGIITTAAVAAHEIPQEIGDFGLLLSKGMSRKKVLWANVLSALSTTLMAAITFLVGSAEVLPLGLLLGLSAGFLLYIAMSDVIPTIHETSSHKKLLDLQPFLLLLGAVVVGLSIQLAHKYIDAGHDNKHENNSSQHDCVTYYDKDGQDVIFRDCPGELDL